VTTGQETAEQTPQRGRPFETRDFYLACFLRCVGYELLGRTRDDASGEAPKMVRAAWDKLEAEFTITAYDMAVQARKLIAADRRAEAGPMLTGYMQRNLDKVLATLETLMVEIGS